MSTTVETSESVINPNTSVFGTGADAIMTPKVPSMFGGKGSSLAEMISKPEGDETSDEALNVITRAAAEATAKGGLLGALSETTTTTEEETGTETTTETTENQEDTPGTKKVSAKDSMIQYLKEQIEAKEFEPYDDYQEGTDLVQYLTNLSDKDRKKLVSENIQTKQNRDREEVRQEVLSSLPGSLQYVAYAVENGATEHDLKDIYAALLRVEETRSLDINNEHDQEAIAYSYLQATNWGNQKEIQDQVEEWKNDGKLEGKVKQFKPKLDQMQEQQVKYQLQQQDEYNRQQAQIQQYYTKNVYDTLKKGEIGGLKLDKKRQNEFYQGLTGVYQSPISGKSVNSLGARLEEIQFSDNPNFELLIKVNWLLNDEEGYETALMQKGKNEAHVETERKLKSAQQSSTKATFEEEETTGIKKKGIQRQKNLFA